MGKAYDGEVNTQHIKIGGQRLLIAPLTASPISSKITDVTNPPTGWRDCGSIAGNNAEVTSEKEIFTLKTGLPQTVKFQECVDVSAKVTAQLNEWNIPNIHDVLGRPPVINTLDGVATDTIQAGSTRSVIVVANTNLFAVGNNVVVDGSGSVSSSANITTITAIVSGTGSLSVAPSLADVPTVGQTVQKVTAIVMGYGDTGINTIQACLVFDAKDGTQIAHLIPKCAISGAYSPSMNKEKEQVVLPITLEAYGVVDASLGNKTIVIKPLIFPA